MASRLILVLAVVGSAIVGTATTNGQFDDVSHWEVFDPGEHAVGIDPDGYWGTVFDGRYVYFVPGNRNGVFHGEVMRYDTEADFQTPASWMTFDPSINDVGVNPIGYMGGAFDGRHVYFAPFGRTDAIKHGEVLRYDTTADFAEALSWEAFDAGNNEVGYDPDGYTGAVFDGRYVYFAPLHNGTRFSGEVLRYDTTANFLARESWETYEAALHGVGDNPTGFHGAVFDGRYVYFVPSVKMVDDLPAVHSEVLRYDTTMGFSDVASWSAFDAAEHSVIERPIAFIHGVFDGRHVYFAPLIDTDGSDSGEVLRYDTSGIFTDVSSWLAYDPGNNGVGVNANGYAGGAFDGRHVYFAPHFDDVSAQDEVLRYDPTMPFMDPSSWDVFDPVGAGATGGIDGRFTAVFDGQYIYFAPFNQDTPHGQVLRYDTRRDVPTVSEWGLGVMTLLFLSAGTIVAMRMGRRREQL